MGRSIEFLTRIGVIGIACAMLMLCMQSVHAQTQNDDRYGFNPIPAPVMPVQQGSLAPTQSPYGPGVQGSGAGFAPAPTAPGYLSGYTPAPAGAVQQNYAPYPAQPAPAYAQTAQPYPQPQYAPQSATPYPAPPQPSYALPQGAAYGYAPLRPMPGAAPQAGYYNTASAATYGTQMPANPYAYMAGSGMGAATSFNSAYVIGAGDKLHVSVFDEPDLTGDFVIDGSGMIRLPLIGTVRAGGITAPALESAIAGALAQGYLKNPRVNVEIMAYRPFYIIGAVNRPGQYAYVDNMSVLNAIAFGGGYTDSARQSTVFVRHEGSPVEEEIPASQVSRIYPGDVVRVKTTLFWDVMSVFQPIAPSVFAAAAITK